MGKNPQVMLVGLNPTSMKELPVQCVFALDNSEFSIYKFIVDKILTPSGLRLGDIYATNLVKCTFSKDKSGQYQEPRRISKGVQGKSDNERLRNFLFPFFQRCEQYFEADVSEIAPKILISFGDVTHHLIVEEYGLDSQGVAKAMKEAFDKGYPVNLFGLNIVYFPCIRQKAFGHQSLARRF